MNKLFLVFKILIVGILVSCNASKEVVYFQDLEEDNTNNVLSKNTFIPKLQSDDIVSISVSAQDMDAAAPFNLFQRSTVNNTIGSGALSNTTTNTPSSTPTYLIDSNGNINFPILGEIKLGGFTRSEAKEVLKNKLKIYLKNPIINIRISNFKVTVLGEVARPGTFAIPNERITVIEALGLAGDMTIKGKRKNVVVIRDLNGEKKFYSIDMTSKAVFQSPAYYLSQNDVVYVTPNKSQIRRSKSNGRTAGLIIGITGVLLSGLNLILREN